MKPGDLVRLQRGRLRYSALTACMTRFHDLYPRDVGLLLERSARRDLALFEGIMVIISPGVLERVR